MRQIKAAQLRIGNRPLQFLILKLHHPSALSTDLMVMRVSIITFFILGRIAKLMLNNQTGVDKKYNGIVKCSTADAELFLIGHYRIKPINVKMSFYGVYSVKYGIAFDWSSIVAIGVVYLITAIEAYGDITANSLISGEPVEGEKFIKRASGGIFADGFNSMLAGIFNSFPNSIFAQNNGMIQLTGVASRYVGYYIAGFLILLGLFPVVGLVFSVMPDAVLGGATLLMFGTVAASGIRIIAAQDIDRKAILVMALSFSLGLSVELVPDILMGFPEAVRSVFASGITTGGLTAIIANALIRIK